VVSHLTTQTINKNNISHEQSGKKKENNISVLSKSYAHNKSAKETKINYKKKENSNNSNKNKCFYYKVNINLGNNLFNLSSSNYNLKNESKTKKKKKIKKKKKNGRKTINNTKNSRFQHSNSPKTNI
jgi:hypothetical protein